MSSVVAKDDFELRNRTVPPEQDDVKLESNNARNNDDRQLARLGKKPVLKVCTIFYPVERSVAET